MLGTILSHLHVALMFGVAAAVFIYGMNRSEFMTWEKPQWVRFGIFALLTVYSVTFACMVFQSWVCWVPGQCRPFIPTFWHAAALMLSVVFLTMSGWSFSGWIVAKVHALVGDDDEAEDE